MNFIIAIMNKIQTGIREEPVNTYGKHCKEKIAWTSRLGDNGCVYTSLAKNIIFLCFVANFFKIINSK